MLKEEMSSLDIATVTAELDRMLKGFHINNIYQLNPKTVLLKLHGPEGSRSQVIFEAGKRVHTTSYVFETPQKPSGFCSALRKYLRGGKIEKVQQQSFERIVETAVANKGEERCLIAELFGEGNFILVDHQKKILHALSYQRMRDRKILRGEPYVYPPPKGKDIRNLRREDLYEIRSFGKLDVVRAIARLLGIGGTYAEEVLFRAHVSKDTPCSALKEEDLDTVFRSLQELLSDITVEDKRPRAFIDEEGDWIDVAPLQLKKYDHLKHVEFQSFNEALDEYYAKVSATEKVSGVKDLVEQEAARLERILHDQEETLRESKRKADAYRKAGDAIYLHLNELQFLIQRAIGDKRSGRSWKDIVETLEREKSESQIPAVYFEALKPQTLSLQVFVEGQTFDLDLRRPAQKKAAEYYAMAKKAEKKIEGVQRAIEQTQEKLRATRLEIIEKAEQVPELPKKRKKEWYEKFRWFHSSDGFLVVGGRDASTNEVLIKKHMEPQDLVFHADIAGAPFALVKTGGRPPSEQTVKEAAQFAALYSRAWREGLGAIDVYWVSPAQVSKTPSSGEYLPKGSFMIYGAKNYVKGEALEVAIGLKKEDQTFRVVGGPPEAVTKQTGLYARLVPGREPSGRLAKEIKSKLAQSAKEEERRTVLKIPLEEIQGFIPSGRGAITATDMRRN